MFGPAFFGVSHYGGTYFPPGGNVVEIPSTGAGGNYGRPLPSLQEYEKRIKKYLDIEQAERLEEKEKLIARLVSLEAEKIKDQKNEEIRQNQEYELKYLLVSESLLQVEKDLAEIAEKRANIKLRARIMRDDDEVMILLYA